VDFSAQPFIDPDTSYMCIYYNHSGKISTYNETREKKQSIIEANYKILYTNYNDKSFDEGEYRQYVYCYHYFVQACDNITSQLYNSTTEVERFNATTRACKMAMKLNYEYEYFYLDYYRVPEKLVRYTSMVLSGFGGLLILYNPRL
jgi:hypothetical protein